MAEEETHVLYDAVIRFFTEDKWNFQELEGKNALRTNFKGDNGLWSCFMRTREDTQRVSFYASMGVNVPPDKRNLMAEFITRVNYGMLIGCFEMDYTDGEVRYRTSIDVEGGELTQTMIKNLVYANILTADRYLPGVMSVAFGNSTPEEAVKKIEGE
jgi:hypothetical protein